MYRYLFWVTVLSALLAGCSGDGTNPIPDAPDTSDPAAVRIGEQAPGTPAPKPGK